MRGVGKGFWGLRLHQANLIFLIIARLFARLFVEINLK